MQGWIRVRIRVSFGIMVSIIVRIRVRYPRWIASNEGRTEKYDFVVRHLSKFGKWLEGGGERQGI